jgi:hypothetical protein
MNLLGRIQRPAGADGLEHNRVEVQGGFVLADKSYFNA